jgi:hypothetical protein
MTTRTIAGAGKGMPHRLSGMARDRFQETEAMAVVGCAVAVAGTARSGGAVRPTVALARGEAWWLGSSPSHQAQAEAGEPRCVAETAGRDDLLGLWFVAWGLGIGAGEGDLMGVMVLRVLNSCPPG